MLRHYPKIKIVLFVGVFLMVVFSHRFCLSEETGEITHLKGRVDLIKAGTKAGIPLRVGDKVNSGDIIRTKSFSGAQVTFIDGSILKIAEKTRLRVEKFHFDKKKKKRRLVLRNFLGRIRSVVSRLLDWNSSTVEVHTPTAVAGVRGTDFITSVESSLFNIALQTEVIVLEGLVEVRARGVERLLKRGEAVTVPKGEVPREIRQTPAHELEFLQKDIFIDKNLESETGSKGKGQPVSTKKPGGFSKPSVAIDVADKASALTGDSNEREFLIDTYSSIIEANQPVTIPVTEDNPALLTPVRVIIKLPHSGN